VALRFRNVDFDERAPLDDWPPEAIETLIDRGSITDWGRLAAAIRANPWGTAARRTEIVLSWGEHYGLDPLFTRVIEHAREDATQRGRERYAAQIRQWRAGTGLTLRAFARAAGTSAPRLCAYERAKVAPTTDVLARLQHVAETHRR